MPFPVSRPRLRALIDAFSGRRLVVAGDFVLDRFVYGHPKRVSREAPVLILRHVRDESVPGGAGNTAANVRALGGEPIPVGVTGRDESGRILRELFRARGIPLDGLVEVADYRTPTKTRILGGAPHAIKQQIVRYDVEDTLAGSEALFAELSSRLAIASR
ncbi:MAG TPA: PfkB family carbohydrate kinase, partial [Usitatibacter sp.]|nr:PfkB family carbohydrate kinase [Usitatibacter sp.]